jgi:acyl-CoA thioesterase FadM
MLLDEVMAKTCLQNNIEAVTARMDIRFKRPVYVNEEVLIRGKILEVRGKKVILTARCIDKLGKDRATAQGLFIRV